MSTRRSQVRWVPTPWMLILLAFDPDGIAGPLAAVGTGVLGVMVLVVAMLLDRALETERLLWWFMVAFGASVVGGSVLALVFRFAAQPWLWRRAPVSSPVGVAWCQWRAAASRLWGERAARSRLLTACREDSPPTIAAASTRYRDDLAPHMGLPLLDPEIVRGLHRYRRWAIVGVCVLLIGGGAAVQALLTGGVVRASVAGVVMLCVLTILLIGRRTRAVALLASSGAVERMDDHRRWTVEDSVLLVTRARRDSVRVTLVGRAGTQVVEFPDANDPALRSLWQRWTSRVYRPDLRPMQDG